MRFLDIFRPKRRTARRIRIDDPTANWMPREWADLPVHHPRFESDSR